VGPVTGYDLTGNEKDLVEWMVEANRQGELGEELKIL